MPALSAFASFRGWPRWRARRRDSPSARRVLSVSSSARADYCGAEGERICLALEKFPSCNVNLTALGPTCKRPACGAQGQKGCLPSQRMKFDPVLQIPVLAVCDQDLKMANDVCAHPATVSSREFGRRPATVCAPS